VDATKVGLRFGAGWVGGCSLVVSGGGRSFTIRSICNWLPNTPIIPIQGATWSGYAVALHQLLLVASAGAFSGGQAAAGRGSGDWRVYNCVVCAAAVWGM